LEEGTGNTSSIGSNSSGSTGAISSTDQVGWWGTTLPEQAELPDQRGICPAFPRVAEASVGLAANTPWVLSYWADFTPGSTCKYTPPTNFALTACTGNQLAPYLVLTAAHCVDDARKRGPLKCPNIRLAAIQLCYSFNRQPGGEFDCSDPVNAVGVSFYARSDTSATTPWDQAIVFLGEQRLPPFYKVSCDAVCVALSQYSVCAHASLEAGF
jgi:hypothetical protein